MLIDKLKSNRDIYYDYWAYRGYTYGECHYNKEIKNIYINIPKNASCNIRNAIVNSGLVGTNLLQSTIFPEYESVVVVLRDPVDRWISGITTYLNLGIAGEFLVDDLLQSLKNNNKWFFEILFDRVSFDDHSERQSYFLQPFDLSNAYYFYIENKDKLEYQLTQFYAGEGVQIKFEAWARNECKHDPIDQFFTAFLFDHKNKKYKDKLIDYFKDDYKIINSVKFYGS
jgi:hypothetical protein